MKKINILSGMAVVTMILVTACTNSSIKPGSVSLKNSLDSVSYAIGIDIGTNLKGNGFKEINANAVALGFMDAFAEKEGFMTQEQAGDYVRQYFSELRDKQANENLAEAEEFLAKNREKEGIIVTESGLQYSVIKAGNGPFPSATDRVSVYYKGTLIDGTEFDASSEGNPVQFRVNGVIPGWTEALQLMPVGSIWKLYIHPNLAYGKNPPRGSNIGVNNALIFEVELVEILNQ